MNFKKLSLAAALSIGVLSVNAIANAACPAGVPCPAGQPCPTAIQQTICPKCQVNPCTCQQQVTVCPTCHLNPCTCAAPVCAPQATLCNPVTGTLPNCHPDAKVYERQAFAFPNIGSSSVVIPKGKGLLQIGGEQESIALGNSCPTGLSAVPEMSGALTLYPKNMTGAAVPFAPVCPNQVMQGTDILRCNIPSATKVLQSNYFDQRFTGAAIPIGSSCDPCQTGAAVPCTVPCDPCATPVVPSCDPCQTGAAAQLSGCPITINTSSGLQLQKTIMTPGAAAPLGCACPVGEQYPDVSNSMESGCDINTLTTAGVLAGYPDKYYKPCQPLLRSELAAAIVHGFNLDGVPAFSQQIFKDVPSCHWANADIDKVYNRGIMTGDSCNRFRPEDAATNAETLSALAKFLPATMAACDVQSVLQKYADSGELPSWAKASVAQALNAGAIKDLPDCNSIKPNSNTQRTDVATIIRSLRQKLCLEPIVPKTISAACPVQPQIISQTIPTLKVQMEDIVTARTSLIGDRFVAKTIEPVTINGQMYPVGSKVQGKVVEVIRPGMGEAGGIRLGFDTIKYEGCKADLPNDILSATVIKEKNPNIIGRVAAWPFTWTGKVAGIVGRTAGGGVTIVGDATEGILNNFGNGNNELFNGKFRAAGRSYISSAREAVMGVYDVGKTAFSGVAGVLKESGDEVAYVVSPDGSRIAQINPRENLSIAFGACNK